MASEQLKAELRSSVRKEGCQTPTVTSKNARVKRQAAAKRRLLRALDRDFQMIGLKPRPQTLPSSRFRAEESIDRNSSGVKPSVIN
jgi:hypothetical protein